MVRRRLGVGAVVAAGCDRRVVASLGVVTDRAVADAEVIGT
jgi:hypothetical protein